MPEIMDVSLRRSSRLPSAAVCSLMTLFSLRRCTPEHLPQISSGTCTGSVAWSPLELILTVDGREEMADRSLSSKPWLVADTETFWSMSSSVSSLRASKLPWLPELEAPLRLARGVCCLDGELMREAAGVRASVAAATQAARARTAPRRATLACSAALAEAPAAATKSLAKLRSLRGPPPNAERTAEEAAGLAHSRSKPEE